MDKTYPDGIREEVKLFTNKLRKGEITSLSEMATTTLNILKKIVSECDWKNAKGLISLIRNAGIILIESQPVESCVGNMVRRVLKITREEYASAGGKQLESDHESLQKMLFVEAESDSDYTKSFPYLKECILESIEELLNEIEDTADNIAEQGIQHLHSHEVIMTIGRSKTIEGFLKRVAKKRKFEVFIAENAPFYSGHELAVSLAKSNIHTTVITDSAIFAVMARVNKVFIGTHSVMANGGLKAMAGTYSMALAAHHHSVPLIVCSGMFKYSAEFPLCHNQDRFNKFVSPESVLDFSDGDVVSKGIVSNPIYDYVPPELVTLYISNVGGNPRSYMYRILSDLYDPRDSVLKKS